MRQFAQHRLILDQQNCFESRAGPRSRFDYGWWSGRLELSRQKDRERRALSNFALNPDVPAALPHDSINGGQPQASTFVSRLSRKEGFKNPITHRLLDANARI